MTRTSPAEVRGLFRRLVKAAERAGVQPGTDFAEWALYEERYVGWQADLGGSSPVFLGRNAHEAAVRLTGMVTALEMVPARGRG